MLSAMAAEICALLCRVPVQSVDMLKNGTWVPLTRTPDNYFEGSGGQYPMHIRVTSILGDTFADTISGIINGPIGPPIRGNAQFPQSEVYPIIGTASLSGPSAPQGDVAQPDINSQAPAAAVAESAGPLASAADQPAPLPPLAARDEPVSSLLPASNDPAELPHDEKAGAPTGSIVGNAAPTGATSTSLDLPAQDGAAERDTAAPPVGQAMRANPENPGLRQAAPPNTPSNAAPRLPLPGNQTSPQDSAPTAHDARMNNAVNVPPAAHSGTRLQPSGIPPVLPTTISAVNDEPVDQLSSASETRSAQVAARLL